MSAGSVHPIPSGPQGHPYSMVAQEVLTELEFLLPDEAKEPEAGASTKQIQSIEKLPGDASTRRYYRVRIENAKRHRLPPSAILARVEPFESLESYPFLVVREHLEKSGVDVPKVFAAHPSSGLILLEDLGDVTLLRRLQEVSSPDVERHLYQKVLDELVQLQLRASPREGCAPIPAFSLFFDHEKLMWEMGFAIEHFYIKHLGRKIGDDDQKTIQAGFSAICTHLAEQPTVLAHRDFHSRNIMVTGGKDAEAGRLVMIDFQDARMGPAQYDLVSLLRDSYYQLEETQVAALIDYYIVRVEALSGTRVNLQEFMRTFDFMAVQRNFKAIGSFASFLNRRGNATYLKFIGNTFENIRRTLLKYPEFSPLREALFHYYYF